MKQMLKKSYSEVDKMMFLKQAKMWGKNFKV